MFKRHDIFLNIWALLPIWHFIFQEDNLLLIVTEIQTGLAILKQDVPPVVIPSSWAMTWLAGAHADNLLLPFPLQKLSICPCATVLNKFSGLNLSSTNVI